MMGISYFPEILIALLRLSLMLVNHVTYIHSLETQILKRSTLRILVVSVWLPNIDVGILTLVIADV